MESRIHSTPDGGGTMQKLLEKAICKVTGKIQNWIEAISYDGTHCHFCHKFMTDEEINAAPRWPSGDSSKPVCAQCKQEILESWYKIWNKA